MSIHSSQICQFCSKAFMGKNCLITHLKTVHSFTMKFKCGIEDCEQEFNFEYLRFGSNNCYEVNPLHITVRFFSFRSLHIRRDHKIVKTYSCDYPNCDFVAKFESVLEDHKYKHTGETPYVCDWIGCGYAVNNRSQLSTHKYRNHSAVFRHTCDLCDQSFLRPSLLKNHKLIKHSNEKPFKCELCHKQFKRKISLKNHMNRFHNMSTQTFKCTFADCDQEFRTTEIRH